MTPYWGATFFSFFYRLIERSKVVVSGAALASDEVQLLVLFLLMVSTVLVGSLLVFRKMTMLANSLSHTTLLGLVIAALLSQWVVPDQSVVFSLTLGKLLIASLAMALVTTFLTEILIRQFHLQKDASIGLVFTSLFVLGILFVTLYFRNLHLGNDAMMGNIDALHTSDIQYVLYVMLLNGLLFFFCYRRYVMTSFDPTFAASCKLYRPVYHYLLMLQTSITAIVAFRVVGVFLFLALLLVPVLIARLFTRSLVPLIFVAIGVGGVSALFSVAFTRHMLSVYALPLSTSATCITLLALVYAFSLRIKRSL